MIAPRPRNCSGVRSPRVIFTSTVEKPCWRCAWTLASRKRSNSVRSPLGEAASGGAFGRAGLLVVVEAQALDQLGPNSRSSTQSPSSSSSSRSRKASIADLVDQHLDPGPGAVDAQPVLAVEDAEDGLGDLQVVAVVGLDEVVDGRRDAGHDRGAAADPDLEALDPVPFAGEEGDVVDAGDRAVLVGAGEGGLDLARHQLRRRVADEVADVGAGVGRSGRRSRRGRRRPRGRR